ncbi:MAG: hypothetical protein H6627_05360 [Calditrichae bacterium]|nr:hypothetical protein [Calditrichota bacterium]MCB9057972.1 hypothetical protein [Calditrichia bacterium]
MLRRLSVLLLLAMTAFFVACGSDDDSTSSNNDSNTDGSMKASVAGSNWEANTAVVAVHMPTTGTLTITGQYTDLSGNSRQMSLTIMQNASVNSFSVGLLGPAQARYTEASLTNPTGESYIGTSGTVEITELTDTSVKGSFSFSGALNGNGAVKQISSGSFSAKL